MTTDTDRRGTLLRAIAVALVTVVVAIGGALVAHRLVHGQDHARAEALVRTAQAELAHGDASDAVVAVERARMLEPRSRALGDVAASLHVSDPESPVARTFRMVSSREWSTLAITAGWMLAGAAALIVLGRQRRLSTASAIASAALLAVASAGVVLASRAEVAVVASGGAPSFVAPYDGATSVGTLEAGTVVVRGEEHGAFVRVESRASGPAWVDGRALAPITRGG